MSNNIEFKRNIIKHEADIHSEKRNLYGLKVLRRELKEKESYKPYKEEMLPYVEKLIADYQASKKSGGRRKLKKTKKSKKSRKHRTRKH
jgi:hypothetical protein